MAFYSNIKQQENKLDFDVMTQNKIKISLMNAIRRIILTEIEISCVDKNTIIFGKNTSMLHDSFLANRLMLFPINHTVIDKFDITNIRASLAIKNTTDHMIDILSGNIVVKNIATGEIIKNIFYSDEILFGKLKPQQEIEMEALFKKTNRRIGGAEYSPVSKSVFVFKQDMDKVNAMAKTMEPAKAREFLTLDAKRIYLRAENGDPAIINMRLETVGSFDPKDIYSQSIDVLRNKLNRLINALANENANKMGINPNNTLTNIDEMKIQVELSKKLYKSFDFTIIDEDDTAGNLLQTYLHNLPEIGYAGFVIPHPLHNKIVITTSLKDEGKNTLENNIKVFIDNIRKIISLIDEMQNQWKSIPQKSAEDDKTKMPAKKIRIKKSPPPKAE